MKFKGASGAGFILVASLALCLALMGHGQSDLPPREPLFLSGTPTADTDEEFPVNLYRLNANGKLRLVREVVPNDEGLHSIRSFGDIAFVAHPHQIPTTISVVHFRDPMKADEVLFNRGEFIVIDSRLTMAQPLGRALRELLLLADPNGDRSKDYLASVTSAHVPGASRVELNQWSDYAALRHDGNVGGPIPTAALLGSFVGPGIIIRGSPPQVRIDTLPAWLIETTRNRVPFILAANERYFLFRLQLTQEDQASGEWTRKTSFTAYLHDRGEGTWKKVLIDGNSSGCRLFGSWLASVVATWNPQHTPNPGRENERTTARGDVRPDVRGLYAAWIGKSFYIPGILVLQHLADGRKIRIQTGQEDSEVLWVGEDTLLYRVNDTIFQAKIIGDQLQNRTILVKDDDVPEIHWAFWSK